MYLWPFSCAWFVRYYRWLYSGDFGGLYWKNDRSLFPWLIGIVKRHLRRSDGSRGWFFFWGHLFRIIYAPQSVSTSPPEPFSNFPYSGSFRRYLQTSACILN